MAGIQEFEGKPSQQVSERNLASSPIVSGLLKTADLAFAQDSSQEAIARIAAFENSGLSPHERVRGYDEAGDLDIAFRRDIGLLRVLMTDSGSAPRIVERAVDGYSKYHQARKSRKIEIMTDLTSQVDELAIQNVGIYLNILKGRTGIDFLRPVINPQSAKEKAFRAELESGKGAPQATIARAAVSEAVEFINQKYSTAYNDLLRTLNNKGVDDDEITAILDPYRDAYGMTSNAKLEAIYNLDLIIEEELQGATNQTVWSENRRVSDGEPIGQRESLKKEDFEDKLKEDEELFNLLVPDSNIRGHNVDKVQKDLRRMRGMTRDRQEPIAKNLSALVDHFAIEAFPMYVTALGELTANSRFTALLAQRFSSVEDPQQRASLAREVVLSTTNVIRGRHSKLYAELEVAQIDSGLKPEDPQVTSSMEKYSVLPNGLSKSKLMLRDLKYDVEKAEESAFASYARLWARLVGTDDAEGAIRAFYLASTPGKRTEMARKMARKLDRYFLRQFKRVKAEHIEGYSEKEVEGKLTDGSRFARGRFLAEMELVKDLKENINRFDADHNTSATGQ